MERLKDEIEMVDELFGTLLNLRLGRRNLENPTKPYDDVYKLLIKCSTLFQIYSDEDMNRPTPHLSPVEMKRTTVNNIAANIEFFHSTWEGTAGQSAALKKEYVYLVMPVDAPTVLNPRNTLARFLLGKFGDMILRLYKVYRYK